MADAYILETAQDTAGIIVAEPGGVRFYAATRHFDRLDGVLYKSVKAARLAVDQLSRQPAEATGTRLTRDGAGRRDRVVRRAA